MIQTMKTCFTLLFFALTLSSSAQSLEQYIPKDATFVFTLHPNHLDKKVNLLELQNYPFYDMLVQQMGMMGGDDSQMMTQMMTAPSEFGLDLMQKSYFFANFDTEFKKFGMIAEVNDNQRFMNFLQGQLPEGVDISRGNGFSFAVPEDDMVIAWKNNMVMIAGVERNELAAEEYDFGGLEEETMEEDWAMEEEVVEEAVEEVEDVPATLEEITEVLEESAAEAEEEIDLSSFEDFFRPDPEIREQSMAWVKENFARTSENSLMTNAKFQADVVKGNDAHLWMDYGLVAKMMEDQQSGDFGDSPYGEMGMQFVQSLLSDLYDNTFYSVGMNWKNGKFSFDIAQYLNAPLQELTNKSLESKYNKKMAKFVRGNELLGIYHLNMNVENTVDGYYEMLKNRVQQMPMVGDMGVSALEILGIAIDEEALASLFAGDMIFAVTGMQQVTQMETVVEYDDDFNAIEKEMEVTKDIPEMTFMMSTGNEKDWMKIIRLGVKAGYIQQDGQNFIINVPDSDLSGTLAIRDDIVFITNSQDLKQKDFKKRYRGKQKIDKKLCKTLCESSQVFFWDIPATMTAFKADEMAGAMGGADFVNMGKQTFESFLVTSDKVVKNGAIHSEMSINFANKDQNSLKTFFDLLNDLFMSMMGGGAKS